MRGARIIIDEGLMPNGADLPHCEPANDTGVRLLGPMEDEWRGTGPQRGAHEELPVEYIPPEQSAA
jgi:hypothetical protein